MSTRAEPAVKTHGSKVSGFLEESLAPEIVAGVTGPLLQRTSAAAMPRFAVINRAHLAMLAEQGLIEAPVAGRLLRHIDALEAEGMAAFTLDPEREDAWFNYEAELTARAGAEAGHVHTARSRNDLKATLDRLNAIELGETLLAACLDLRAALLNRAEFEAATVMPGYTHLQHAQPVSFGWYLLGVEAALAKDCGRIEDALARMNECPLGAGAFAGTEFAIDRARTADLLGFARPQAHPLDSVANRDALVELGAAAAMLSTTLGRLAQDFYLWSTFEFGLLRFPDRAAITSSIMPQKKNLTVLEHLKARPAALAGALMTALAASRGTPFGHSQEIGAETGRWLWEAIAELRDMLPAARVVVECVEPLRERMKDLAGANFATATMLADALATDCGLPFREAHHIVGRFVRLRLAGEAPQAALEKASVEIAGHVVTISAERLAAALDPASVLSAEEGCGPNLRETARLLALAEARLAEAKAAASERSDVRASAADRLAQACAVLIAQADSEEGAGAA